MRAAPKVLVFGSVNIDIVFHACAKLPSPGETVSCASCSRLNGGKGANQAVACATVCGEDGVDVDFVGCLSSSDDAFVLGALVERGVDVSKCQLESGVETGTACVLVDTRAENCIVVSPGANDCLSAEKFIKVMDSMHDAPGYACALFQLETPFKESVAVAERVRRDENNPCVTFLNFSPAKPELADAVLACEHIDCLVVNETEAKVLADFIEGEHGHKDEYKYEDEDEDEDEDDYNYHARRITEFSDKFVLLTRGAAGASFYLPHMPVSHGDTVYDQCYSARALRLNEGEVVDTVGAGDAFVGAFVSSVARNRLVVDAMGIASAAGALACTEPGARPRAIANAQDLAHSVDTTATSAYLFNCPTRELFKRLCIDIAHFN